MILFDLPLFPLGFLLGLIFGSFANVCILRIPEKKSIAWPGSACPKCQAPLKWHENIPVFSWLLLRGRCRKCQEKISYQYPSVEILTAFLFGWAAQHFGLTFQLLEALILIFGLVCITFIDLKHMIIPDVFSLPGIVLGLALALISPDRTFLGAVAGVLVGGGFFYAIAWIYATFRKREGLGGGDIKLMAALGAFLGWQSIPYIVLVSSLVGSLVGLSLLLFQRKNLKTEIPYGPYIAVAALSYLLEWPPFSH